MHASKRPLTVLLAEDTAVNQTLVVRLLEKRGHTVLLAANGREAVAVFESQPVDLILMDLQMPEMDGFEATRAIRRLHVPGRRAVPIVALSVHNSRADRERCLLAGMDACIAKPIDVSQLAELVETLAIRSPPSAPPAANQQPRGAMDFRAAIERLGGDLNLFRELASFFKSDAPELIDRTRAALAAGNAAEVALAAHTLKGLASNFNAHRAAEVAGQLEKMGQNQNLTEGDSLTTVLAQEVEAITRALAEFCQRLPAPDTSKQQLPFNR